MLSPEVGVGVTRRRVLGASLAAVLAPRRARATVCPTLVADPAGLLDLPLGFSYTVLESTGDLMDDGYPVPGMPDGMGAFTLLNGDLALLRNHELNPKSLLGAYSAGNAPPEAFDPLSMGGVSRLVLDPVTYVRRSSNLVLCGTNRNCSGGGGSLGWISCEEDVAPGHGYAFACDPEATTVQPPVRMDHFGRFNHEAAAIDEVTGDVYLTEDRVDGCLYRSTSVGGVHVLQVLRVVGLPSFATTTMLAGDTVTIEWVDVGNPTPKADVLRARGAALGAAVVRRGEGITANGQLFAISATAGGPIGSGQLFELDAVGLTLTCLASSASRLTLDMPDNLTISPWGQLFFAEDGHGTDYLRCLTSAGDFCDVAYQADGSTEIAGVCFAPAGDALFCNLQERGVTVAITGPLQATFDL